jgi:hypothetical protein
MSPDQLSGAARNLAHGLGIPVYIRDGRIFQHGPGLVFLPPSAIHPTVARDRSLIEEERTRRNERQLTNEDGFHLK